MKKKLQVNKPISYRSDKIVEDVKQHLKTASDLYEQYIEAHASSMIDPVTNAEFLREGWSQNIIHNDTLVKKVEDSFSFLINLNNAKFLIIKASLKGSDLFLHPVEITFTVHNKTIGVVTLQYTCLTNYTIAVPEELRKEHAVITAKVKKMTSTSQVFIRSIVAVHSDVLANSLDESLFELERIKRDTTQLFQFLEWHKNPELLLPGNPKKSFAKKVAKKVASKLLGRFSDSLLIKRIVLKLIRPFTTPQILFNQYLLEIIHLQEKRNDKLEEMLLASLKEHKKIK